MHLGTSLISHGDCWHIGRSSFLEKDILFMILHIWLGINLHLSLCNLSESMRGTPSWKLRDLGKCLHHPTKKAIANIVEKLSMLFFGQKMGKMTILKLFPNIVSHWCPLCVNLSIGFHFESFCIMKIKLCYFPNCLLRNKFPCPFVNRDTYSFCYNWISIRMFLSDRNMTHCFFSL